MPIVQLFGTGGEGKSANVTAQRRINLYAEAPPDADKSGFVLYTRPGLVQAYTYHGSSPTAISTNGGVRCMISGWQQLSTGRREWMYAVIGTSFCYSSAPNSLIYGSDGTFVAGDTPIDAADNGFAVLFVDGNNGRLYGYLPVLGGEEYESTEADFPSNANSCCFIAGRFVVNVPNSPGRFQWSELNLAITDGITGWPALNYATAESIPDPLFAVRERAGELLLFGARTIEVWAPSSGTEVFAKVGGSYIQWGLAAKWSPQNIGGVVYFVGNDEGGTIKVCALNGYSVAVISTPDIERIIADDDSPNSATAVVVSKDGHTFYVLNLSDRSLAFDVSNQVWGEWRTEGGRFAGRTSALVYGTSFIGDYRDSRIYAPSSETYTDDGATIVREVQTRHIASDLDRMTLWEVALDVEAGVGLSEGQGSDPQIMMQISRDGGHTFGNELWQSLGALGEYAKRVVWRRLGMAGDLVLRFRITDAVKVVILGASIRIEK